jgi:hypothetical protein
MSSVGPNSSRRTVLKGGLGAATAAALGGNLRMPAAAADAPASTAAHELLPSFLTPPRSWAPRVWWHWMSPNITRDGIIKDLDWMRRTGIGGFHQFTGDGGRSVYVPEPAVYMTPEFKDAWRTAIEGAAERKLEATLSSSAGWSITGAPFVAGPDGMKKHVWTETRVTGDNRKLRLSLPRPPEAKGTFLDSMVTQKSLNPQPDLYVDQRVFAYRVDDTADSAPSVSFSAYSATASGAVETNGDAGVQLNATDAAKMGNDSVADPLYLRKTRPWVRFEYAEPITVHAFTVAAGGSFDGWVNLIESGNAIAIYSSTDGTTWGSDLALKDATGSNLYNGVQRTIAIRPTAARYYKVQWLGGADIALRKLVLRTAPTVHKWEHKAGFGAVGNFYKIDTPDGTRTGVPKSAVIDLTSRMAADGTLEWSAPRGHWVVVRLGYSLTGHENGPTAATATGLEVDKLDARRVRAYLNTYLDEFESIVPDELWGGDGLSGVLCDSFEAGFQTWTDTILDKFSKRYRYDPGPWLPALTGTIVENAAETDRFLWDWRNLLSELLAEAHYGTIRDVVHERGLQRFVSQAQEDRRGWFGDDLAMRARADIPMGASRSVTTTLGGVVQEQFRLDMKGASSLAHVYGRPYAACEAFTITGGRYVPRDLKPFADQLLVAGTTQFVVHSSDHQPLDGGPGTTLDGIGWYMNRNQTWAEQAKPFATWMGRTSGLLNQGTNVADLAYFYGQEAALSGQWLPAPAGTGVQPDVARHHQYDFVNGEMLLDELHIKNAELVTRSGQSYPLLYLGGMADRMTLPVLAKIREFVRHGGAVCGPKPTGSPSLGDNQTTFSRYARELWGDGTETFRTVGKGSVMAGLDPDTALARIHVAPDLAFEPAEAALTFVHRRTANTDIYFVVNNDHSNPVTTELSLRTAAAGVELWDAVTGEVRRATFTTSSGRTTVPMTLRAADSIFVVVTRGRSGSATIPPISEQPTPTTIGAWDLTFSPPRGTPDSLRLETLVPLSGHSVTDVKYYAGTVVYHTTLTTDLDPATLRDARILLDLGEANEFAEVTLNGTDMGEILWRAPYRLDVTGVVRKGANTLEVRVTNTWFNRIVGDLQPGVTTRYATRYNNETFGASAGAALLPSGLVGPVSLIVQRGPKPIRVSAQPSS